jgi:hypothetical protein
MQKVLNRNRKAVRKVGPGDRKPATLVPVPSDLRTRRACGLRSSRCSLGIARRGRPSFIRSRSIAMCPKYVNVPHVAEPVYGNHHADDNSEPRSASVRTRTPGGGLALPALLP